MLLRYLKKIFYNSVAELRSKYKGEHDKIGLQKFNEIICEFAEKYKGKNMMTIQNELP